VSRQQDRCAVVAQRAADNNAITWADMRCAKRDTGTERADAAGREIQAAALAAMRSSRTISKPSSIRKLRLSQRGVAPLTARSLTVPWTASEPISPPGNSSGSTMKLSVVNTSRASVAGRMALSADVSRAEPPKWWANMSRTNSRMKRPPFPCARRMWS
jgi:hypothetical protein